MFHGRAPTPKPKASHSHRSAHTYRRKELTKVPTRKFALLLGRWKRLRRSRPKKPTQALNWPRIGVQRAQPVSIWLRRTVATART
eukprot:scaffold17701_cov113-Isochrysis_galbana.AAC.10